MGFVQTRCGDQSIHRTASRCDEVTSEDVAAGRVCDLPRLGALEPRGLDSDSARVEADQLRFMCAYGMSYVSALQGCLSQFPSESKALAVSAAIRVNGLLHWSSPDSQAGLAAGNAIFPIYSITKTLTAICVLRLFERRSLELTYQVR
jgi:hypothetical protein